MKLKPLALVPVVVFAVLAGLMAGGNFRADREALPSTREGQPAPALTLETLEGRPGFDAAVLTAPGVKLVNFWASWCAPCRVEHPVLQALADEGIAIYGINYKDDPEKARAFLDELGDPYAGIGTDERGRTALDWGVYGVPETYVIDGEGRVVLRFAGPITASALESRIRPAIEAAEAVETAQR